jgi:RHS repeat-associated protein
MNRCHSSFCHSSKNPYPGISPKSTIASGCNRYASPNGESLLVRIKGNHTAIPATTADYSLLTAHCGSHLGSSSWITDSAGHAVQHLHYLPWGEDFVDQRINSFDGVRYTFSAKERDPETGLSYFGSRYYSSDLSIWLSVDPMAAKYPSLSPYTYCADNPVKLVDPNGDTIAVVINQKRYTYDGNNLVDKNGKIATFGKNTFGGRVLSDLNKLKNSKCEMIRNKLRDMMNSKHLHTIVNRTTPKGVGYNRALNTELAEKYGEGSDTETGYNPFATKSVCADGGYVSCATLAHELLGHGWNNDQGLHESDDHRTKNGIKFEEINAINVQNKVLVEYLQKPRSLVGSSDDAKQIPVNLINHYYTTKPK